MKVLIISSIKSFERDNVDFSQALPLDIRGDFDVKVVRVQDLAMRFSMQQELNSIRLDDGRDISDFDLVFIKRSAASSHYYAQTCGLYLKMRNVRFINTEVAHVSNISANKIVDHMLFASFGYPIPDTFIVSEHSLDSVERQYSAEFNFPMVLKSSIGSRGNDNYLVHSFQEVRDIVMRDPKDYLLQPFIENDFDYRLIVLGEKLRLIIKRSRVSDDTHMNNTSQGGKAELVPLEKIDPKIKDLCEDLAARFDRQLTGVDIMIAKNDGALVLLESNRPPEIETGTFVEEKCRALADYFNEIVNNS